MTADLSALIARLEAAEAGSRELDEAISDALCVRKTRHFIAGVQDELWMYEFDGHAPSSALRVTTSLDAALALAERVLGGWAWRVDHWGAMSRITLNECDNEGWHRSKHQRIEVAVEQPPALALVIAILRAKQGEG